MKKWTCILLTCLLLFTVTVAASPVQRTAAGPPGKVETVMHSDVNCNFVFDSPATVVIADMAGSIVVDIGFPQLFSYNSKDYSDLTSPVVYLERLCSIHYNNYYKTSLVYKPAIIPIKLE